KAEGSSDIFEEGEESENEINFTSFILEKPTTWLPETTVAYQELVAIISHDQFNSLKVPRNICSLRRYRLRLPILPVHQHKGEDRTEFWHGKIWSESPLFSDDILKITFPGFVPFGAKFADFIKPFITDMQQLQSGIRMARAI
ncbi:4832_t:CDS:2, partial [Racocetra persica]